MKLFGLVVMALLSLTNGRQGGETISGFIVQIKGAWTVRMPGKTATLAATGMAVPNDSLLQLHGGPEAAAKGEVTVALFDGSSLKCNRAAGCAELTVSLPVSRAPLADRCRMLFSRFFSTPKERYISALSRTGAESSLRDAIVEITSRGIDLRPALAGDSTKVLHLLLQRAGRPSQELRWSRIREVRVSAANPLISGVDLQPGLYRLVELGPGDEREPTGTEAWVLLVYPRPSSSEGCSQEDLNDLVEGWYPELEHNFWVRLFLRYVFDRARP